MSFSAYSDDQSQLLNNLINNLIDAEIVALCFEKYRSHKNKGLIALNLTEQQLLTLSNLSSNRQDRIRRINVMKESNSDNYNINNQRRTNEINNNNSEQPNGYYTIINHSPNFDIFGKPINGKGSKINIETKCPQCKTTMNATRFAPHLSKCMGMGRTSSRNSGHINYFE